MPLALIDDSFWGAGFLGHILLLYVLVKQKRIAEFPMFSLFVIANLARTTVLYPIRHYGSQAAYFYVYWGWALFDTAIQLFCTAELAAKVFRPRARWAAGLKRPAFLWITASVFISSLLTALAKPDVTQTIQRVVMRFDLFTSILVCMLVVGLIVLSSQRGLPLRTHVATIAVGLGAYALAGVVIDSGRTYFGVQRGTEMYTNLSYLRMGVYLVCLGYWASGLWRGSIRQNEYTDEVIRDLSVISRNADAGLRYLRSKGRE